MITFSSIKDALKYVNLAVEDVLQNEVADAVKDVEVDAIRETVYDAYGNVATDEPNLYNRRYDSGGLIDRENMVAEVANGTLTVSNITPANDGYSPDYGNDGYLASEIVLGGGPYHWPKGAGTYGNFRSRRDFIGATYDNLKRSKSHVAALKNGLKKRGLNVE